MPMALSQPTFTPTNNHCFSAGKRSAPTNDLGQQRLHFGVAGFAIARAHQIWRRQHAPLPAPIAPGNFQCAIGVPAAPLDVVGVGWIVSRRRFVPPIPQIGSGLPPLLAIELHNNGQFLLLAEREQAA